MNFADIEILSKPHDAQRGLLVGGTRTGKSTLGEKLCEAFLERYRAKDAREFFADTKPRFRAEWLLNGMSAAKLYKNWDHGPALKGSVLLDLQRGGDYGLADAWKLGFKVVIAQSEHMRDRPLILDAIDKFFRAARGNTHPQLLYVDELLDFFGRTGMPIKGADFDSILRVVRAGGEKGQAFLGASQRPRGIPVQLISEMSKAYVFKLDYAADIEHLYDMGMPENVRPPTVKYPFLFFDKDTGKVATLKLKL